MKIINLGRGQGKTVRLLYASEWNDIPILCATDSQKQHLIDMAKRLGLNIPEPIVTWEIQSSKVINSRVAEKDWLVDEAPMVLRSLLHSMGMKGEVRAITLTSDELKQEI
jgi:hypothetical protein